MRNKQRFHTLSREGELSRGKIDRHQNWQRSPFSQNSNRPLHNWFLPIPQDLIIVCFSTLLISIILIPFSRVKGEKIQIFRVTLRLFVDNLIIKATPAWNLNRWWNFCRLEFFEATGRTKGHRLGKRLHTFHRHSGWLLLVTLPPTYHLRW